MKRIKDFTQNELEDIVLNFKIHVNIDTIRPFGNGHINDTFLIKTAINEPNYILQCKNHHIFKNIPGMMENILVVTQQIKSLLEKESVPDINRRVIEHYPTYDKLYYFKDKFGNYWTLFNYISGSVSVEKIDNPQQAYATGKAFGRFQHLISGIDGNKLNETIENFHNIYFRLNNFENAIRLNAYSRLTSVRRWIDELLAQAEEMKTLQKLLDSGDLPLRITHNDTKINNILFDEKTGEPLCIIDLDTVMPGLVHFDFGDAMRSGANTVAEDHTVLSEIDFNLNVFEQFAAGFLTETKSILTGNEKKYLAHSVKFMTYIMALRFMTDYLEGDVYYKILYPEHNLDRSINQLVLISRMNDKYQEMCAIIEKYS